MKYWADRINKIVVNNRYDDLITASESRHTMQFENLVRLIVESHKYSLNKNITDAVLVTGPSSSGKTTTSKLLSAYLKDEGFNVIIISFDDFYHDLNTVCRLQNKPEGTSAEKLDLECPEAFDIEYFKILMNKFLSGEEITLPKYDFLQKKRVPGTKISPTDRDVIIVEGIHALNPVLTDGVNFSKTFKVYICPFDFYGAEGLNEVLRPENIRFMRRSVRDRVDRGSDLSKTMSMWASVRDGEEKYIKPMKQYADFFFNSSLEYEICLLKTRFIKMVEELDKGDLIELKKGFPLGVLMEYMDVNHADIPKISIFREFYK
ncbi:MAG: hypothetical protein E7388_01535 [Ruminococcaceae bacterium]|nr:hypothetical protein [Oscillospiraceae bacterium]